MQDYLNLSNDVKIPIPGYGKMAQDAPTRALVLQAMVEFALEHQGSPTLNQILSRVRELQEQAQVPVLAVKSQRSIQFHVENLVRGGFLVASGKVRPGRNNQRAYWPACLDVTIKSNAR